MGMLPLKWEAIIIIGSRVIDVLMRVDDDRLAKVVMLEALELGSKVQWGEEFPPEFGEVWVDRIGCDDTEWIDGKKVKQLLKNTVWQRARSDWKEEAMGKSN